MALTAPTLLLLLFRYLYLLNNQSTIASFRYSDDTLRHLLVVAVVEGVAEAAVVEVVAQVEVVEEVEAVAAMEAEAAVMEMTAEVEEGVEG
jgi:hypothetical protein